ncbi:MAG TPA: oligosaccharide flippase family protein, partial [Ardenticatenaceae bacterium]|nr:oligosaccharide flippase family protein [Ardenticatenaceae bacterium]
MYEATKNGALLVAAFFIMAVLNYAFGVTLSWFFGPAEDGVVGVAQSLLLLTALVVGSGFAWTAAHDVAELGLGDESRRRFRAAWVANTGLGLLLAGALWAAYALGWLPLGPAYRLVVPLVGLTTVILAARAVVNGALRGLYRFGPLGLNQVGEVIIKSMAGLALVAAGAGAEGVMIGFALGSAAALLHSLWVVGSSRLWRGPGWLDGNVVAATVPLFAGMMGPALMLYLDVLGLKLLAPAALGDELAGFYQAAVILARTPVFMAQALTAALFSYVAGSAREGTTPASYMQAALRAWARVLLPAALVLALAPGAALDLFFPPAYQV